MVGLGLGALAILSGIVMLGALSGRWERAAARAADPGDAAYARAVAASRGATGQDLLWAGAAMLLATVGALAGSLDDRTGALLVATTATVAALGLLLRAHLYRVRHPLPRRSRAPRSIVQPASPAAARVVPLENRGAPAALLAFDERDREAAAANGVSADEVFADASRAEMAVPESAADIPELAYSFMRDDAPEGEARKTPYSFMLDANGIDEPTAGDPSREALSGDEVLPAVDDPELPTEVAMPDEAGDADDDLAAEGRERPS